MGRSAGQPEGQAEGQSEGRLAGRLAARELARGPARLVQALGIGKEANGTSMVDGTGPLLLSPPPAPVDPSSVSAGPRVGVASAHDIPWRFWLTGEPSVSAYRRHVPRLRK